MAISQGNQHLRVFVATAAGVDIAAGADWENDAVFVPGSASFIDIATGAGTVIQPASKDVQIAYKYPDGTILRSQIIPAAAAVVGKASVADSPKVQTLTVPATVTGKLNYVIRLALPAYGGTISQEDTIYMYGSYKAEDSDTVDTIATALAASLELSLKKLPVASFDTPSASGATITLTSLVQPSVLDRFEGDPFDFYVELTGDYAAAGVTTDELVIGRGLGRQVVEHEAFFAGYDSDYINRARNWPANGNPQLVASKSETYKTFTFVTEIAQGGAAPVSQKQTTILYVVE